MHDFHTYVVRHGEFGVQAIVERWERYEGIHAGIDASLEERWNGFIGNDNTPVRELERRQPESGAMTYVTYKDLTTRYGNQGARAVIRAIETLAQIQDNAITPFDQGARLERALECLNNVHAGA